LEDGTNIVKIKGSKPNPDITVSLLESLLELDNTFEIKPERWFRDITEARINIKSTLYTLKITQNKRQIVYLDDKFSSTNPENF
jgi:hypothetical protein